MSGKTKSNTIYLSVPTLLILGWIPLTGVTVPTSTVGIVSFTSSILLDNSTCSAYKPFISSTVDIGALVPSSNSKLD